MTAKQIAAIISEIGDYKMNQLIPLSEVQSIVLTMDYCIYPGETTRVKFVNTNGMNLLLVYFGRMDGGEFITSDTPNAVISADEIEEFLLVNNARIPEPFKYGVTI